MLRAIGEAVGDYQADGFYATFEVAARTWRDGSLLTGDYSERSATLLVPVDQRTKLATPTDVTLSEDGTVTWKDFDGRAEEYSVRYDIVAVDGGRRECSGHWFAANELDVTGSVATADISSGISDAYWDNGSDGEEIEISVRVVARAPDGSKTLVDSDYSAFSRSITYVDKIKSRLKTPSDVTLSADGTLSWEGVDPQTDTYEYTLWFCEGDSPSIGRPCYAQAKDLAVEGSRAAVSVADQLANAYEDFGLTGPAPVRVEVIAHPAAGSATRVVSKASELSAPTAYTPSNVAYIDVTVDGAATTVPVSAYKLGAPSTGDEATELAGSVASAIGAIMGGDASGTSLGSPEEVAAAQDKIRGAIRAGDKLRVELEVEPEAESSFSDKWADIERALGSGCEFASAYDATVRLSHRDGDGRREAICDLTELDSSLEFELELPPARSGSVVRLARIHDGDVARVSYTATGNGTCTVSSREFSDYVFVYGRESHAESSSSKGTAPVQMHRLYNPNSGEHHYTASEGERDLLVAAGWRYEGVGWHSDDARGVAVLRQYNPNARAGSHNYTTSAAERDLLVAAGWRDEGIGWYGLAG